MKRSQLGWVLAAAMVGVTIGGGFQAKSDKLGYLDMQGIYQDSNLKKKNDDRLHNAAQVRQAAIDSLGMFPAFSQTQLARFRALSVKDALTPAETAELAKLKTDAEAATKQYDDLRQKAQPTAQDVALLNDFGERTNLDARERVAWQQAFAAELDRMQIDLNSRATDDIRLAVAQIAKQQGYSLVFRENIAVYGSNDLGKTVQKIVDKNAK